MGLDFRQSNAHWSYSGFGHFRDRLALMIGIDLDRMAGFAENGLPWDNIKDDIVPLLHHSDCDGKLTPAEMARVFPRLRELVSQWPKDDYSRIQAEILAKDMEILVKKKKDLVFC